MFPPSTLISSTAPSNPSCKLKLFRNVTCMRDSPVISKILGESSRLSLMALGSLTNAALGGESAGGEGSPELEVTQNILSGSIAFVADHPAGSAGATTSSKASVKIRSGVHDPAGSSLLKTEKAVAAKTTKAAAAIANVVAPAH